MHYPHLIQKQQFDMMIKMASGNCLTRPISQVSNENLTQNQQSKKELEKRVLLSSTTAPGSGPSFYQRANQKMNSTIGSEDQMSARCIKTPKGLENTLDKNEDLRPILMADQKSNKKRIYVVKRAAP